MGINLSLIAGTQNARGPRTLRPIPVLLSSCEGGPFSCVAKPRSKPHQDVRSDPAPRSAFPKRRAFL
jgi:hypothetical protein